MENLHSFYKVYFNKAKQKNNAFVENENPYEIIFQFFEVACIKDHLLVLKKMRKHAIGVTCFKDGVADVLYRYKLLSNMLNAAWIIHKTGLRFIDLVSVSKHRFKGELLTDTEAIRYLKPEEIDNPYLGIRNLYKDFNLGKYHEYLYELFSLSLAPNDYINPGKQEKEMYKNIRKLIVYFRLIYQNEMTQAKDISPIQDTNDVIPNPVDKALDHLFKTLSPTKLSMSLRKMLIGYMCYNSNDLPVDFEDVVNDCSQLSNLLDGIIHKDTHKN